MPLNFDKKDRNFKSSCKKNELIKLARFIKIINNI